MTSLKPLASLAGGALTGLAVVPTGNMPAGAGDGCWRPSPVWSARRSPDASRPRAGSTTRLPPHPAWLLEARLLPPVWRQALRRG